MLLKDVFKALMQLIYSTHSTHSTHSTSPTHSACPAFFALKRPRISSTLLEVREWRRVEQQVLISAQLDVKNPPGTMKCLRGWEIPGKSIVVVYRCYIYLSIDPSIHLSIEFMIIPWCPIQLSLIHGKDWEHVAAPFRPENARGTKYQQFLERPWASAHLRVRSEQFLAFANCVAIFGQIHRWKLRKKQRNLEKTERNCVVCVRYRSVLQGHFQVGTGKVQACTFQAVFFYIEGGCSDSNKL